MRHDVRYSEAPASIPHGDPAVSALGILDCLIPHPEPTASSHLTINATIITSIPLPPRHSHGLLLIRLVKSTCCTAHMANCLLSSLPESTHRAVFSKAWARPSSGGQDNLMWTGHGAFSYAPSTCPLGQLGAGSDSWGCGMPMKKSSDLTALPSRTDRRGQGRTPRCGPVCRCQPAGASEKSVPKHGLFEGRPG